MTLDIFSHYFVSHKMFCTKLCQVFRYIFEMNSSFRLKNHQRRTLFPLLRNVSWTEHLNLNLCEKKNMFDDEKWSCQVVSASLACLSISVENEKLSYDNNNVAFYDCTYMPLIMKKYIFKSTNVVFIFFKMHCRLHN